MKCCLVADSSAVIRKVARHFLTEARWRVDEAETAAETRGLYGNSSPDLVILDWQIAGSDAIELIKELRRLDSGYRPRILYLTSVEDRREIWQALRSGADGYMLKPFDRASFTQSLKELLPDEIAMPEIRVGLRA
jgi:two-component system chemotaxis response regulator CheY